MTPPTLISVRGASTENPFGDRTLDSIKTEDGAWRGAGTSRIEDAATVSDNGSHHHITSALQSIKEHLQLTNVKLRPGVWGGSVHPIKFLGRVTPARCGVSEIIIGHPRTVAHGYESITCCACHKADAGDNLPG